MKHVFGVVFVLVWFFLIYLVLFESPVFWQ